MHFRVFEMDQREITPTQCVHKTCFSIRGEVTLSSPLAPAKIGSTFKSKIK